MDGVKTSELTFVTEPTEELRGQIREALEAGHSRNAVARRLTELGVPTRRSKSSWWDATQVRAFAHAGGWREHVHQYRPRIR
jgi:hypothetical protein